MTAAQHQMKHLRHVALFANPNGVNVNLDGMVPHLAGIDGLDVTVLSLAEHLPPYADFPSFDRKKRIEEILHQAACHEASRLAESVRKAGLSCKDSIVLHGRFPTAVKEWVDSSTVDLIVKESLPSDCEFGFVSKGDLKLTRTSRVPVLLIHSKIDKRGEVLVGIPPSLDGSNEAFCIKLLDSAVGWAKLLGARLHVVQAWTLFGETLLRSGNRLSPEDLKTELDQQSCHARSHVRSIMNKCDLKGLKVETHVEKGDATRVLSTMIELHKPALVVLGSAANEGIKGALLGNTAETIARRKMTSVLVIR